MKTEIVFIKRGGKILYRINDSKLLFTYTETDSLFLNKKP